MNASIDGVAQPGLVIQHEDDVPPALLAEWLEARAIPWRLTEVERDGGPELEEAPWAVVLGSHHSAAAGEPDWIPAEIERLRAASEAGTPLLGICFGAQALAVALGGRIEPALPLEARWDDAIEILDPGLIPPGPWLNFHYDRFTLPTGATLLARTPTGPSALRHGRALGVQFHPEVTAEIASGWAAEYDDDRVDTAALARDGAAAMAGARERAFDLFDRWWASFVASPAGRAAAATTHAGDGR
jgi:GMP synthase-like glutamine amidotransferase